MTLKNQEKVMARGVHGEKLISLKESEKLPLKDIARVDTAIEYYDAWIRKLNNVDSNKSIIEVVSEMVAILNEYKLFIDYTLIFSSDEDFLYRQKGQLKLDNTVIEEFLPLLVKKCLTKQYPQLDVDICSQRAVFSSMHFTSGLSTNLPGGGIKIKTKDQDFSMSRPLYLKSSHHSDYHDSEEIQTYIGYLLAELKTNLDKTMFQEAAATAHDVKLAVTGAKYYLLCDFLDTTPISTATTDIDEILILRKSKRIPSNIRKSFSSKKGREKYSTFYKQFLLDNPYREDVFLRFINHVLSQMTNEKMKESEVLDSGFF